MVEAVQATLYPDGHGPGRDELVLHRSAAGKSETVPTASGGGARRCVPLDERSDDSLRATRTRIRRLCGQHGLSLLVTLTARRGVQVDWQRFRRRGWARVRRAGGYGDGPWLAVAEYHESGDIHLHVAVRPMRRWNYRAMIAAWQSILTGRRVTRPLRGAASPGYVQVGGKRRGQGRAVCTSTHAARYLARYLAKGGAVLGSERAYVTGGCGPIQRHQLGPMSLAEAEGDGWHVHGVIGLSPTGYTVAFLLQRTPPRGPPFEIWIGEAKETIDSAAGN